MLFRSKCITQAFYEHFQAFAMGSIRVKPGYCLASRELLKVLLVTCSSPFSHYGSMQLRPLINFIAIFKCSAI
mgnify:CR=1 FL=1